MKAAPTFTLGDLMRAGKPRIAKVPAPAKPASTLRLLRLPLANAKVRTGPGY
jgi:hypothetical protein